ncbi:Peptide methionine sulfoxide reductase MsrA [Arenibacter antarcticus]|uniref:peptide-methionine (S)-S-oxide reductase n=1 Tax=Arenibacter antarcticus TaxID=2040469 RepID=A0ABW5VJI6_9FLAO|nr:peptide-methionine (S)-S-oxide reductase [Arenibacter sp. H213]MCM4169134.1 peptide methionine sulfoxide reductase [Arenibacter sp. H213]
MVNTDKIAFGGGCHWCTEAVFLALKGVTSVAQGFVASEGEAISFSEAVVVHYNKQLIDLTDLILIHLHTHNSTSGHSMRNKYRSAVYTFTVLDSERAKSALHRFQSNFEGKLITQILPFVTFKSSDPMFHNYYFNDRGKPFCQNYIVPKLKILLEKFNKHVDATKLIDQ